MASIEKELNNYKCALAANKSRSNLKTIVDAVAQAEEQKEILQKRKQEIEEYQNINQLYYDHELMKQRLSEYKRTLLEGNFKARQDVIRTYIKKITVFPTGEIKVEYSPAVTFLPDSQCRFKVDAGSGI